MANHAVSGKRCIIDSCRISRRQNLNVKLFKFPYKDEELLNSWLEACELDRSLLDGKRLYICDKHFAVEDVGKSRLKRNVIPQKNLKTNVDKLPMPIPMPLENKTKLTVKKKIYDTRKSGRYCVLCKMTHRLNPLIRLFTFPREPERFKKWINICQLKPSDIHMKRLIICEKHFLKSELKGRRYTNNAEPRFFLSNIPKIIENPKITTKLNLTHCIIKDCNIINDQNSNVKLLTFPKEATNLFNIWSDIFHINKEDIFNIKLSKLDDDNLYICEKHFLNYSKRPNIFTEIKNIDNIVEENSRNKNNHDENEIDNIKLEFVSTTDPLENNWVIKEENLFKINDKIESERNNFDNVINKMKNLQKLLTEKEKFYQKKIKNIQKRYINDRKLYYKNIRNLQHKNRILNNLCVRDN